MMAKSLELCASGQHQTEWKYFNEGRLELDKSFRMEEQCQTAPDFEPPSAQKVVRFVHVF